MAQTNAERYGQNDRFIEDCPFSLMLTDEKAVIEVTLKHTTMRLRLRREDWDHMIAHAEVKRAVTRS